MYLFRVRSEVILKRPTQDFYSGTGQDRWKSRGEKTPGYPGNLSLRSTAFASRNHLSLPIALSDYIASSRLLSTELFEQQQEKYNIRLTDIRQRNGFNISNKQQTHLFMGMSISHKQNKIFLMNLEIMAEA